MTAPDFDSRLQPLVAVSLAALADALAPVPDQRWNEPSMCEGWAVRHVIAHLTMAARHDEAAFTAELTANGFDFQTTSDRIALRDGELPPEALLADLRGETMASFPQPGGGFAGSLSHVVIHGLDATQPLGLERSCSDEAARTVLDSLVATTPNVFGVDTSGLAIRATDLDWSYGTGQLVDRSAAELLLALSGRAID
ncbi:MAG TPA: maleylpyruvate isomerase family mycothiol-dependent enzyme [Microlunatus sp.]|nr:maleylpyruvate isomerase family mycothiol-dependent enzyme [Microlunatus sp.]